MFAKTLGTIFIIFFIIGCNKPHFVPNDKNTTAPKLIEKPLFIYPRYAQENELTGKVQLILLINKSGKVNSVIMDKPSGHKILDDVAVSFAEQFKYIPAEINGHPIRFYVEHTVDYSLVETNKIARDYIKKVKELQRDLKRSSPEMNLEIQKELLTAHDNFIKSNTDNLNYNQYIKEIIKDKSYNRWKKSWKDWPLHFIVFDDYQKCYPNSKMNKVARDFMFKYIKKDLDDTKIFLNTDQDLIKKRENIYKELNNFLNEEYAGIVPDSLIHLFQ